MNTKFAFAKLESLKQTEIVHGLSKALWDSDLVATRLTLFIAELSWGIMLLWPGDTFNRPTYHGMSLLMSEVMWGLVLMFSGFAQLFIVSTEKLHSLPSRIFAGCNAMLWFILIVSMLISVYPPPAAIGGEIALAFGAGWIWIRPYILNDMYNSACKVCSYER